MLEAFRILEEDKGIKKEDIIDAVVESLRSAYRRRYGQSDSVAIDFNEKTGDFVIVINAEKVKLTGKKATDKIYYTHSNHPGGLKSFYNLKK